MTKPTAPKAVSGFTSMRQLLTKKKRDDWEKDHTVDIEASRGQNHYVTESGKKAGRRPKLHKDWQLHSDVVDRTEQRKKRLAEIKSGKAAKNGKKYIESIMIERK